MGRDPWRAPASLTRKAASSRRMLHANATSSMVITSQRRGSAPRPGQTERAIQAREVCGRYAAGAGEGVSPRARRLWINIPLPARRPAAARAPYGDCQVRLIMHQTHATHRWAGVAGVAGPACAPTLSQRGHTAGWSRDAWPHRETGPARPALTRWQTRDIRSAKSPRF